MVEDPNEKALLKAGAEFLASLQRLGLDPEACFWVWDEELSTMALMLMTSAFDTVGPLEISNTLIKAYAASALPGIIDPFMLRLHSPNHSLIQHMIAARWHDLKVKPTVPTRVVLGGTPYSFMYDWMYKFELPKSKSWDVRRKWNRFERNVEALAA